MNRYRSIEETPAAQSILWQLQVVGPMKAFTLGDGQVYWMGEKHAADSGFGCTDRLMGAMLDADMVQQDPETGLVRAPPPNVRKFPAKTAVSR